MQTSQYLKMIRAVEQYDDQAVLEKFPRFLLHVFFHVIARQGLRGDTHIKQAIALIKQHRPTMWLTLRQELFNGFIETEGGQLN